MSFTDLDSLEKELEDILPPNFRFGSLKSGEIVIYTGLTENDEGEIVEMDTDEEEDGDMDPDGDLFDPLPDEEEDDDD